MLARMVSMEKREVLVLAKAHGSRPRLIDVDLPRPRHRNEADFVAMRRLLMAEFGFHLR